MICYSELTQKQRDEIARKGILENKKREEQADKLKKHKQTIPFFSDRTYSCGGLRK